MSGATERTALLGVQSRGEPTPLPLPLSPWCPSGLLASPDDGSPRNSLLGTARGTDTVLIQDALDSEGNAVKDNKEIYISCCDALGLGCMVTRAFVDFGLRIVSCDFSTDGRYCFIMFKVEPTPSPTPKKVEKDWGLLRESLVSICPADSLGALYYKPKFPKAHKAQFYHIVTVKCEDRAGLINWLMSNFWRYNMTIHRLKCVTTSDGEAVDEFYVSDSRPESKESAFENMDNMGALIESIKKNLDATVTTATIEDEYDTSIRRTRRLSYGNVATIFERHSERSLASQSFNSTCTRVSDSLLGSPAKFTDFADAMYSSEAIDRYCTASVEVDNSTSTENTILRCVCPDRKGVLYDFFRLLSDVRLKASYGRIATSSSMCEALLFVKDGKNGGQIQNEQAQDRLKDLIYSVIARPFQLQLEASPIRDCMELRVVAPVDASGRGRPRVIYDVTTALSCLDVHIHEAEMYVTGKLEEINQTETHVFHIKAGRKDLFESDAFKEAIYERVFCELMGVMKTKRNTLVSHYPREAQKKLTRLCPCMRWLTS